MRHSFLILLIIAISANLALWLAATAPRDCVPVSETMQHDTAKMPEVGEARLNRRFI